MIRLVTFDLDNTLWETDPVIMAAEQACYQWLQQHTPAVTQLYDLAGLFQYKRQLLQSYPDWHFQLTKLRYETYRRLIMQAGYNAETAEQKAADLMQVFHQYRNQVTLYPSVEPTLTQLANQFSLMTITNGNSDLEKIGLDHLFDQHFSAETSGAAKPDPRMFQQALEAAAATPKLTLHIGDHALQDIAAAQRLGMRTAWFNPQGQSWQEAIGRYLDDHPWAEAVVPDIEFQQWQELPRQLNAL